MKDPNLDIPIFSSSQQELNKITKVWTPDRYLTFSQTVGTEVTCRICRGGKMVIIQSEISKKMVLKYCIHCHGTGKMRI